MDCTVHVANNNGADFWSPAAMGNNVFSPSTKHSEYWILLLLLELVLSNSTFCKWGILCFAYNGVSLPVMTARFWGKKGQKMVKADSHEGLESKFTLTHGYVET